jgi:hypothetical protein
MKVGYRLRGPRHRTPVPVLSEIRRYNPLLFDFVLKRHLVAKGKRFAASVFETRRFFIRGLSG